MGWPTKAQREAKLKQQQETQGEPVTEKLIATETKPKTLDKHCPWCAYAPEEEMLVPKEVHYEVRRNIVKDGEALVVVEDKVRTDMVPKVAVESKVAETTGGQSQCLTCGKIWAKAALGKPWTIELEMGDAWARENRARQLVGK